MTAARKINLLIVEDDGKLRQIIREAAERSAAYDTVTAVQDGQAAWDYIWRCIRAGEPAPDFILSDLSMPRMDGLCLIRKLKRHAQTNTIPIAIMTSSNRPNDREDAAAAGCCAFFDKPVRFADFVALAMALPGICADAAAGSASPGA